MLRKAFLVGTFFSVGGFLSGELCSSLVAATVVQPSRIVSDSSNPLLESGDSQIDTAVEPVGTREKKPFGLPFELPFNIPCIALKTNLLFDALSLINLELEVPVCPNVSVAGELIFPWWRWEKAVSAVELMQGHIEGKYWWGDRTKLKPLTGWFTSLYGGGGKYDFGNKKQGYQGENWLVGVGGGYAHSIGKHLQLEYTLGFGYLSTNYRLYEPKFGDDGQWYLIRKHTARVGWIGPTRAKVSLVWILNGRDKR
ncbi:MAG: DUF3575 domain-containing protein [Phocaeicola sp.]